MSANRKTVRRLAAGDYVKCVDYIRRYEVRLVAERPNERKLAEELAREIGVPVSPASVAQLKEHAGVAWAGKKARTPPNANGGQTHATRRMLRTVAWAAIKLYEKLGEPVPESLAAAHEYLKLGAPAVTDEQLAFIQAGQSVLEQTFPIGPPDTRTFATIRTATNGTH